MSPAKYGYDRQQSDPVSFGRARVDGMPFRGPAPLLREDEYEALTEQVNDFHHGLYDVSNPEHAKIIQEVGDRAANGWYQVKAFERNWVTKPDGSTTMMVYLAYVVPYREVARDRVNALMPAPVPFPRIAS